MTDQPENHDHQSLTLILWLVWGSLLFSLVVFALTAALIPPPENYAPPEIAQGHPPKILIILVLATASLIPLLLKTRERMFFEPLGDKCFPGSPEARSAYFTMSLTTWVMCEIVGIFGFVLHFLTYEPLMALPFVAVAVVLMVVFRPKPSVAERGHSD